MLLMVSDTHRIDQTHKVCITLEVIDKHTASSSQKCLYYLIYIVKKESEKENEKCKM